MKPILSILAAVLLFAACNSNTKTETTAPEKMDTTKVKDTTKAKDTSARSDYNPATPAPTNSQF